MGTSRWSSTTRAIIIGAVFGVLAKLPGELIAERIIDRQEAKALERFVIDLKDKAVLYRVDTGKSPRDLKALLTHNEKVPPYLEVKKRQPGSSGRFLRLDEEEVLTWDGVKGLEKSVFLDVDSQRPEATALTFHLTQGQLEDCLSLGVMFLKEQEIRLSQKKEWYQSLRIRADNVAPLARLGPIDELTLASRQGQSSVSYESKVARLCQSAFSTPYVGFVTMEWVGL